MSARNRASARTATACRLLSSLLPAAIVLATLPVAAADFPMAGRAEGRRVLYVDSYHEGYETSALKQEAVRRILGSQGVTMSVVYLDEKRHGDEASLLAAARLAAEKARQWKPDLIVAADDAASKYVVVPFFRDAETPVVFFDVNWTPEPYGYPFRNTTGQVEVELIAELVETLRPYARGPRVALLSADTLTDRRAAEYYENPLRVRLAKVRLVRTYQEFKEAYLSLQKDADMVVFRNKAGISGWDDGDARAFIQSSTLVPTGTLTPTMSPWAVVSLEKVNEEGAEWAARTALRILGGTHPADIPLTRNRQARVVVNMSLAKKLGIHFPVEFLEGATFVEETRP